jgi:hypothetical protein
MNDGLLIIERIIIESISKKEKNLQEIMSDTNLNHSLLLNVLPNLLMKNMIRYTRGIYSIEKENCVKWLSDINRKDNVKEEAKELFVSLVNQYFKKDLEKTPSPLPQLKIQKVWLTRDEEMILNSHLAGLDSFFNGVKASRRVKPEKEKTYEQKVVIWGHSQYSDLVEGVLEAV